MKQRLLVGAIVLAAIALRLYHLGETPTVFFHDECDNTVNAIQILGGKGPGFFGLDWKPQPALAVHLLAGTLATFGASISAVRLPSALLSALALIPFYIVARRAVAPASALLAMVLFGTHLGYLHFSRTGWENTQICVWTLAAMALLRRAEDRGNWWAWALAGVAAALASLTYFAGRAVIVFLGMYGLVILMRSRNRVRVIIGGTVMALAFIATIAPYLPTIYNNWDMFMLRTQTVFFTSEMPPNPGAAAIVSQLATSTIYAAQTTVRGEVNNQPRYFPVERPLFDPIVNALFAIGMLMSWRYRRETVLWWFALLIPYIMTQVLTSPTRIPDLARGIGMLPIAFLFAAIGIDVFVQVSGRFQTATVALLTLLILASAATNVRDYFAWANSDALTRPLEPAIQRGDFPYWWKAQEEWIKTGRFLNVDMWKQTRGSYVPGASGGS